MRSVKHAGPPIFIVALVAGAVGYILGCTQGQREKNAQANGQPASGAESDGPSAEQTASETPNSAVPNRYRK